MNDRKTITVDEDELFDIMCQYGETEDKLCKFLIVLEALAYRYEEIGYEELHANLSVIKGYLEVLQQELAQAIIRTDEFLLGK